MTEEDLHEAIIKIWRVNQNATTQAFQEVFGDSLGEHLWGKFCDCGCDVVKFYWCLDLTNRKSLYLNLDKLGRPRCA